MLRIVKYVARLQGFLVNKDIGDLAELNLFAGILTLSIKDLLMCSKYMFLLIFSSNLR